MRTTKKVLLFIWGGMVNRSLKLEILGGISLIMFTSLTVILNGVEGSKEIQDKSTLIKDVTFPALEESSALIKIVEDTQSSLLDGIEDEDEYVLEELEEYKESFDVAIETIIEKNGDTRLSVIKESYSIYYDYSVKVMKIVVSEGIGGIPSELLQVNHANILNERIRAYRSSELDRFQKELKSIYLQAENFSLVFLISGLILLLVIIGITLRTENIFKSLSRLVDKGNNLAEGDLLDEIKTSRTDEIGELTKALEKSRKAIINARSKNEN